MKKLFTGLSLSFLLLSLCGTASAQDSKWRLGASLGLSSNTYQMSTSYQSDWKTTHGIGAIVGLSAQYDVKDWFGIRTDVQFMQRNYSKGRMVYPVVYDYVNNYLQVPVMASFSYGGNKWRGFANIGLYGGYWASSSAKVTIMDLFGVNDDLIDLSQSGMINDTRDNRGVFGYVAGAGVDYHFTPHWSLQGELRYYYDATSQVKQYQSHVKDYRYNGTLGFQFTMFYHF